MSRISAAPQPAELSFDYRRVLSNGNDQVLVQISDDGSSFDTILTLQGNNTDGGYTNFAVDISAYISSTTTIRLLADNDMEGSDFVYIDNVDITYQTLVAQTNYETTYTENGAPASIAAAGPTISDANDTQMESANIVLTNAQAGDVLSVGALPPGILSNIVLGVGTITVQLSDSSLAAYQAAIQAVAFSTTSDTPSPVDRIINVTVNDGEVRLEYRHHHNERRSCQRPADGYPGHGQFRHIGRYQWRRHDDRKWFSLVHSFERRSGRCFGIYLHVQWRRNSSVTVDGDSETFTMNPTTGAVTTTALAYDDPATVVMSVRSTDDDGAARNETVTLASAKMASTTRSINRLQPTTRSSMALAATIRCSADQQGTG